MSRRRLLFLILCLAVASSALSPGCDCDRHAEQKQDNKELQQLQQQRQLLLDTLNHLTAGKTKLTDAEATWAQQLRMEIQKVDEQLKQRWQVSTDLP